jgi:hypothetical protein
MRHTRDEFIDLLNARLGRETGLGELWDAEAHYKANLAALNASPFHTGLQHRCERAAERGERHPGKPKLVMTKVWHPPVPKRGIYTETVRDKNPELWQASKVRVSKLHLRAPVAGELIFFKPTRDVFIDLERETRWRRGEKRKHDERRAEVLAILAEAEIDGIWATNDPEPSVIGAKHTMSFNEKRLRELVSAAEAREYVTDRPERLGPVPARAFHYEALPSIDLEGGDGNEREGDFGIGMWK